MNEPLTPDPVESVIASHLKEWDRLGDLYDSIPVEDADSRHQVGLMMMAADANFASAGRSVRRLSEQSPSETVDTQTQKAPFYRRVINALLTHN